MAAVTRSNKDPRVQGLLGCGMRAVPSQRTCSRACSVYTTASPVLWAVSSEVERFVDTEEVRGSIPLSPTICVFRERTWISELLLMTHRLNTLSVMASPSSWLFRSSFPSRNDLSLLPGLAVCLWT